MRRRLSERASAIAGIALLPGSISASGAALEKGPDESLLLTVLGEKLILRAEDAENIAVSGPNHRNCIEDEFGKRGFDPKPPQSLMNTLARWLVDPVKASCFETLPSPMADDEHGHFSVVFVASGHGVYKFLSGLNLNYLQDGIHFANSDLTIGRQVPKIPDYCAQIPPEAAVDSNGYRQGALKGGGVAFVSRSGESASQPACIVCSKITEWTCRESIPDANSRVRMDVAWWQHDFKSSPDWTEIDSAARRFVNTILPFRDNSDFK